MPQLQDIIDQATWLIDQSDHTDLDDLWTSDPQLFENLAREWREEHPMAGLGG